MPRFSDIPRPIVMQLGDLSCHIDWILIELLCSHLRDAGSSASVVLVGHRTDKLFFLPSEDNLFWIPHDPFVDLDSYIEVADVIIEPHLAVDAVDPRLHRVSMSGVPIVSTGISLDARTIIRKDRLDFVETVRELLDGEGLA